MKILVLNAGSSSHKCAIFEKDEKTPVWTGSLDWSKVAGKVFIKFKVRDKEAKEETLPIISSFDGIKELLKNVDCLNEVQLIAHRVVHGGDTFKEPVIINLQVKDTIRDLIKIAPLHNPANLEGIEIMEKLFPGIAQVAVFDTAFHQSIGKVASTYAIPENLRNQGIKRYGFHGISHEYCMKKAFEIVPYIKDAKIISCHLGNGASLAAINKGKSIDTTMGFTPMEGLIMGTRSGSIDPGIIIHLITQNKLTGDDLNKILNFESGLKGVSLGASDMREILKRIKLNDENAKLAFDMFIHSLKGFIAKMAASLQGLDILIFTAGIGENSPEVRLAACNGLKFLNVEIDENKNNSGMLNVDISKDGSKVEILVIKTDEEYAIKESALKLIST